MWLNMYGSNFLHYQPFTLLFNSFITFIQDLWISTIASNNFLNCSLTWQIP